MVKEGYSTRFLQASELAAAYRYKTPEYSAQRARETHPIKRQPRPDELAFAVAFLCSERAGAITGSAIHVDGGAKMLG